MACGAGHLFHIARVRIAVILCMIAKKKGNEQYANPLSIVAQKRVKVN